MLPATLAVTEISTKLPDRPAIPKRSSIHQLVGLSGRELPELWNYQQTQQWCQDAIAPTSPPPTLDELLQPCPATIPVVLRNSETVVDSRAQSS
jgi:hypothetical protein